MADLRSGLFGAYYGSFWGESSSLTVDQMHINANYIYSYLSSKGWTINAVAGILANIQAESGLNPGRWQGDDVGATTMGYSLVQWTPSTNYTDWCYSQGYSDPSEMDNALARIIYELENNLQYIATDSYPLSFTEFSKSTESPSYLAEAFLVNYERPKNQSDEVKALRGSFANNWYTVLSGSEPSEPTTPTIKTVRKTAFNFLLFKKRRFTRNEKRRIY